MLYCYWDMAHDRCNYFSFWTIFCPFTPQTAPKKSKLKKKKKKKWKKTPQNTNPPRDIIILCNCTKNHDHILYSSWDVGHDRCNCYFSFWAIFYPFTPTPTPPPPLKAQKISILKKWKKYLEISSFYICVPKIMIRWCTVPVYSAQQTDGQTYRKRDM